MFTLISLSAQNLDLIVTSDNDSIACKILNEEGNSVHFQGRLNGASMGSLVGKSNRKLELTAGYNLNFPAGLEINPAGNLGFRSQKPGGYVFRMGAGYPEYFYLSFGVAFSPRLD